MKLLFTFLLLTYSTFTFSQSNQDEIDVSGAEVEDLFFEEFENENQPWTNIEHENGDEVEYDLHNGIAYLISYDEDYPAVKLLSGFGYNELENYIIESSIMYLGEDPSSSNDMLWGVSPDLSQGYRMGFNDLGQVHIQKLIDGTWEDILPWTSNNYIEKEDYNILTVQKIGNEYNLFINDDNFFNFEAEKLPNDHDITGFITEGNTIAVDDLYIFKVTLPTPVQNVSHASQHITSLQTVISTAPTKEEPTTSRGLTVIKNNNESTDVIGKYYALIIGVQDYTHNSIKDLQFPIRDAENFKNILESKYGFTPQNIRFLKNPTRSDVYRAFNQLRNTVTPKDNVLIFYAGHGHYDEKVKEGYWLPSNAEEGDDSGWIANSGLRTKIDAIHSNHTLLISDACFGGSIFKPSRSAFSDAGRSIVQSYEKKSRKGMTSGTLKTVPDESIFMKYLLKALKENNKKYMTASSLFYSFNEAVGNNSYNTPQFGVLFQVGDEGGQFVFINQDGVTGE